MSTTHPFDQSTQLTAKDDGFHGQITAEYGNMVGPYGGIIGACLLQAVIDHPERRGVPLSITLNYAAPLAATEHRIAVQLVRNNRSTQHWSLQLFQEGDTPLMTATVITAQRRETWSDTELKAPQTPAANSLKPIPTQGFPTWVGQYDMRFMQGVVTLQDADKSDDSTSLLWVRDEPARPLDYASLMAISDCFFPRLFVRHQQMAATGTITLTTYFHASEDDLAAQGSDHLLAQARGKRFFNGYFDQAGELWGSNGQLLATTHQLVYFKM